MLKGTIFGDNYNRLKTYLQLSDGGILYVGEACGPKRNPLYCYDPVTDEHTLLATLLSPEFYVDDEENAIYISLTNSIPIDLVAEKD